MHADEIRDMNELAIQESLDRSRQSLMRMRFDAATRKLKNHQEIKVVKRDIARLLTILREREIEALYAAEIAELQTLANTVQAEGRAAR